MPSILGVTIPFFALVLCGYLAARSNVLPEEAVPGLNAFVLFFALPCMLFRFGNSLPLQQLLDPTVIAVVLLCALGIVAFTVATTWTRQVHLKDAAFGALVAAFPNSGFMGVPMIVAILGTAAAGPLMTSLVIDLVITSSLCIAIAQSHDAAGQGARVAALRALKAALVNPLPWAIALGAGLALLEIGLPGPIAQVVKMLGDAASPVALFTIGAVLWRSSRPRFAEFEDSEWQVSQGGTRRRRKARRPVRRNAVPWSRVWPVALIKLLLHPLLMLMFGAAAYQLGGSITPFQITVLVLAAALPSASNVSMLAERYGADNGRIARIIMTSTALSFVTVSALAWLFGAQPKG